MTGEGVTASGRRGVTSSEQPTRVLLLRTRYPHWSGHAALNRFAAAIDPRAFDVREQLVHDGDDDFPVRFRPARLLARAAACSPRMPYYKLSDLAAETGALREALRGRVDIVHYLDGEHGARHLPALLHRLRNRNARTVATYHQPPEFLGSLVPERVVRALDMVTVVAPHQAEWFEQRIGPDRVRVILHPTNVDFFRPPARRSEESEFRCITVGHWLRDWKAMAAVTRILSGHRDVHFDLVTGRETGCEGTERVTHHRGISDEELLRLYQQADLLLLPLDSATANNSLLEGIACGLPVVTTDMPAMRAYLPEGAGFLVPDNDPSAIADAILQLRDDARLRATMGRRARARAEELSWPRIAPEYERLYREVTEA
jgi:glycosyltransferase involved in cell wall biosynthesis